MIVILFGVTGSGKTTIGRLLAQQLNWKFRDADEFHSRANLEKMRNGIPLTDADRAPWLEQVRNVIEQSIAEGENMVLACSALKQQYRDRLQVGDEVKWVLLKGEYELIAERLRARRDHFMDPDLLRSQFDTLDDPMRPTLVADVNSSLADIVQSIRSDLRI